MYLKCDMDILVLSAGFWPGVAGVLLPTVKARSPHHQLLDVGTELKRTQNRHWVRWRREEFAFLPCWHVNSP